MAGVHGSDDFRIVQGKVGYFAPAERVVLEQVHFLFHTPENPQDVLYVRSIPIRDVTLMILFLQMSG
jgi:hypothetical protein